ncbi:hypothetical protein ACFL01_03430 [Planctomycetota bacterium]
MALLSRRRKKKEPEPEKKIAVMDQEEKLQEEVTALDENDKVATLDRVKREVEAKVHEAVEHTIEQFKLLEQGRCPSCGTRLEEFLYTSICSHCGFSKRLSPETGKVVVHLHDGGVIECDKIFEIRNNAHLCVRNDVVVARLNEAAVNYVEYVWTSEELEDIRKRKDRESVKICDWCGRRISSDSQDANDIRVAIGINQNKFFFCAKKCFKSFQKQYPARVHRDCYERACEQCDECIKKYQEK